MPKSVFGRQEDNHRSLAVMQRLNVKLDGRQIEVGVFDFLPHGRLDAAVLGAGQDGRPVFVILLGDNQFPKLDFLRPLVLAQLGLVTGDGIHEPERTRSAAVLGDMQGPIGQDHAGEQWGPAGVTFGPDETSKMRFVEWHVLHCNAKLELFWHYSGGAV